MSGADVRRKLRLGPFELSIGERVLRRDGQVLFLGGRALDVLIYLAERPGEVIATLPPSAGIIVGWPAEFV